MGSWSYLEKVSIPWIEQGEVSLEWNLSREKSVEETSVNRGR